MKSKWTTNFLNARFKGGANTDSMSNIDLGTPKKEDRPTSVFVFLSAIILIIFMVLTGVSVAASNLFDKQINELTKILEQKETVFQPTLIKSINDFSKQVEGIKKLQTKQSNILPIFTTTFSLATPSTQYTKLSLNRIDVDLYSVSIFATTQSLPGYLQQLRGFQKVDALENQKISSVRIGENQTVSFSMNGQISPNSLTKNNSNFSSKNENIDILNIEEIDQTRDSIIEGGSLGKEKK